MEKDVAVRRCLHPDGLVDLAIEIAPGVGIVDRLRVVLDGAEAAVETNVARCQRCSLNTDPPGRQARAAQQAAQVVKPEDPVPVVRRMTWVDPKRIRRKE